MNDLTNLKAKAEHGDSQYQLGHAHWDRAQTNKDQADHWFREVAERGHPEAQFHLGIEYIVPAKKPPIFER